MLTVVDETNKKYNIQTIVEELDFGIEWKYNEQVHPNMSNNLEKTAGFDEAFYFGTKFETSSTSFTLISANINKRNADLLIANLNEIFFNEYGYPKRLRILMNHHQTVEPKFKYGMLEGPLSVEYGTEFISVDLRILFTSSYFMSEELYTTGEIPVKTSGYENHYIAVQQEGLLAKPFIFVKGTGEDLEIWSNDEYVKLGDLKGEVDETANNLLLGTATFTPIVTLYESGVGDYQVVLDGVNLKITNTKGYYGDESRIAWPLSEFVYLDGSYLTISMNIKSGYREPVSNSFVRVRVPYGEWVTLNPSGLEGSGYFEHYEATIKLPNNKLRVDELYLQVANLRHPSGEYPNSIIFGANSMILSRANTNTSWTPARAEVASTKNYLLGTGDFKTVVPVLHSAGASEYSFTVKDANLIIWNKGGYYGDETRFRWPLSTGIKCIGQTMTLSANIKSGYEPPVANGFIRFRVPFTSDWVRLNKTAMDTPGVFKKYSAQIVLPNTGQIINEIYFQAANLAQPSGAFDTLMVIQNQSLKLEDGSVANNWSSTPYSIVEIDTDRYVVRKNLKETNIKIPRNFLLRPDSQVRVRGKDLDVTVEIQHRNTYR